MSTEFVRVPFYVEKTGEKTHFLPARRGPSGYRIGAKMMEKVVTDYWEALAYVSAMQRPTFRRLNAAGNSGGVACGHGDFEEVRRDFIELERAKFGG